MSERQASVAQWVERVQAVLKAAEADGVKWDYETNYCEVDDCAGCCNTPMPLAASRDDGYRLVSIY